ncbi:MAG: hypothetical protein GF344_00575 [Chitinivibrionales bacterium]|nr:hypothetical protein [Chitinivibrionales bacterium]MBD3355616.1 hypothetical protein [Chitinivibrionales bacterium]
MSKSIRRISGASFILDDATKVVADSLTPLFAEAAYAKIRYSSRIPVKGFKKLVNARNVTFVLNDSICLKASREFYRRMDEASRTISFPLDKE